MLVSLRLHELEGFFHIHSTTESIIWPLFIFLFFSHIEAVAVLPMIVSITTIIFTFSAGKIDKRKRNKMIILGSFLIAVIWIYNHKRWKRLQRKDRENEKI